MKNRIENERGIALTVAILGIVLMGTLITAAFVPTMMEYALAENTRRTGQAFSAAEHGLVETVENWNAGTLNGLNVLDSSLVSGSAPLGSGSYSGYVKRLSQELFMVQISGADPSGAARQPMASFVKLNAIGVDIQAALTVQGPTTVGGSAQIDGADHVPTDWGSCGAPGSSLAGVRIPDASDLQTKGGCSGASCIDGDPAVSEDPTVADSTFFDFGDMTYDDLKEAATISLSPGTYTQIGPEVDSGQCDTSDLSNWGDPHPSSPTAPCANYFPIIHVPGNVSLNGNYGQGFLLVDGDLSVQGGFEFFGVVIVRGRLSTTGTGGHFNGAVMAANVDLDLSKILGNAVVTFSSCAVQKALTSAAPASRLGSRGWLHAN